MSELVVGTVDDDEIIRLLRAFSSVPDGEAGFCLFPGCDSSPVRNHSISKSISLKRLNHKGQVIAPEVSLPPLQPGRGRATPPKSKSPVSFKLVGINDASAFRGLCQLHDHQLWKELDTISYMDLASYRPPGTSKWIEIENVDEQSGKFAFLLLYRAVMHAASIGIAVLRSYLQQDFVRFGSVAHLSDPFAGQVLSSMMTLRYKLKLDQLYADERWDSVVQRGVRIGPCEDTWAYSQFIFLDDITDFHPGGASFTLLPGAGECVFACVTLREYAEELSRYLERNWLPPSHSDFRASVSKMALQDGQNIYIHPPFWHALSKQRRQRIESYWAATAIYGATPYFVDQDLNLFKPPTGSVQSG